MLTNEQLESKLESRPAPRVTKESINERIKGVEFIRIGGTVTVCSITLDNGYSVRGESACVNPENYDREIGEKIAFDNAFSNLWPLFGFLLAEGNYNNQCKAA